MRAFWLALVFCMLGAAAHAAVATIAPAQTTPRNTASPSVSSTTPATLAPFPATGYASYAFRDLDAPRGLRLIEGNAEGSVGYSVRRDEVVSAARLHLILANSAGFPAGTRLEVAMNGDTVGTVDVGSERHDPTAVDLQVNPVLISDYNRVTFRLIGVAVAACRINDSGPWLTVGSTSAIDIASDRLPLANDLSILPLPFFDERDPHPVFANFVFAQAPSQTVLEAAGIVSSWLGGLASYRGVRFPSSFGAVPPGNAILFATGGDVVPGITLPQVVGPTVAMIQNPSDSGSRILLVLGQDAKDLKAAARGLALGGGALKPGAVSAVTAVPSADRHVYDAPGWIPDNRPVKFSELATDDALRVHGLHPDAVKIDFKTAPDYFNWINADIPMKLRFRVMPERVVDLDRSRLNVDLNDNNFKNIQLAEDTAFLAVDRPVHEETVEIPPFLLTGRNRLYLYFNLIPGPDCDAARAASLVSEIDPNSTIDLSHSPHYATMPNLSYFANAGFPFTRHADLSETGIVMPDAITPDDVEAFLEVMALFGEATGYPGLEAVVVRPEDVNSVAGRDLVLIGSFSRQPLLTDWAPRAGLVVEGGELRAETRSWWEKFKLLFEWRNRRSHIVDVNDWLQSQPGGEAALISFQSPLDDRRTVVAVTGSDPGHLVQTTQALQNSDSLSKVQDDLALVRGKDVESFRVSRPYERGLIPRWTWLRWKLSDQPIVIAILLFIACAALGGVAYVLLGLKARRRMQGAGR